MFVDEHMLIKTANNAVSELFFFFKSSDAVECFF